jgi:hypothetical protein
MCPFLRKEYLGHAGPTSLSTQSTEGSLSSMGPLGAYERRHQRVPDSQRADTTPIPPGAQYGATQGKAEKGKRLRYTAFATLRNPLQRLMDHS